MESCNFSKWWEFFIHKKFTHCLALTEAGEGCVRLEPLAWGLLTIYHPICIDNYLLSVAKSDVTALLSVTVDYRCHPKHMKRDILISCVSVMKAILLLKKPWIFTPFQLYKYLVKYQENCIVIKPYIPYIRG